MNYLTQKKNLSLTHLNQPKKNSNPFDKTLTMKFDE